MEEHSDYLTHLYPDLFSFYTCSCCGEKKHESEFYIQRATYTPKIKQKSETRPVTARCKVCIKEAIKKVSIQQYLHRLAKNRAKEKGIDFDIEPEDIIVPEYCPILHFKLERNQTHGARENSTTLDRIDNSKGYVKGNVMVISYKANAMKSNATAEELINFSKWVQNHYSNKETEVYTKI